MGTNFIECAKNVMEEFEIVEIIESGDNYAVALDIYGDEFRFEKPFPDMSSISVSWER